MSTSQLSVGSTPPFPGRLPKSIVMVVHPVVVTAELIAVNGMPADESLSVDDEKDSERSGCAPEMSNLRPAKLLSNAVSSKSESAA